MHLQVVNAAKYLDGKGYEENLILQLQIKSQSNNGEMNFKASQLWLVAHKWDLWGLFLQTSDVIFHTTWNQRSPWFGEIHEKVSIFGLKLLTFNGFVLFDQPKK